MVNTRLYSLHFSEAYKKPLWPIVLELKKLFSAETEITNTFNRINLIFSHDQQKDEVVATVAMLNFGFKAENGPTKIWEIPICFDPIFSNDLAVIP
jgi:allophanate hydrolase subunit 1